MLCAGDRAGHAAGDAVEGFLGGVAAQAGGFDLLLGVVAQMKDPECAMFVALELLTKEYLISNRRGTNIRRTGIMMRQVSKY